MSDTTKAKHTPGPWRHIRQRAADDSHDVTAPGWGVVATCGRQSCDDGVIAANARLIAAAPAMLEALRDIAGRGPVPGYGSAGALLVRLAGIQSIARAAVAAATGEG